MKIHALIQANTGIPFYKVKIGEYFQHTVFEGGHYVGSLYLYDAGQVLKKVDTVGAIDYPYDKSSEENILFISDKEIVKVVKRTDKVYKEYTKEVEALLHRWNDIYISIKK